MKQTILVVDDTLVNIDLIKAALSETYLVQAAVSGEMALAIVEEQKPDIVLLDIMMPEMDGYEVCRRLKANEKTRDVPVIFLTAKSDIADETKGLGLGAVDYITKPISVPIVQARVRTHLALYDQTRELERMVELRTAELAKTRLQIIRRLGCASEFRDNETGNHVIRMSHYSRLIAQAAGMGEESVDILFNAAPLHDVGKIGVPDSVLLHPGKLDQAGWEVIRRHPVIGAKIIGNHQDVLLQTAYTVALMHHEKWDGSGYPNKLKGAEIQLVARIIAIADVFDALTSDRPYKKAWPIEDAVRLIEESAGSHFDPGLIKAFQSVLPEILHIKEKYAEEQGAMIDKEW